MSTRSGRPALPAAALEALRGSPAVGGWDVMFPLLTVDEAGFPHTCLLSRSELDARPSLVVAAVASRHTSDNLRRRGRAGLMIVTAEAAYHCKLMAIRLYHGDSGILGVAFEMVSAKRDGIGIPLEPPRFLVARTLREEENWQASRRVLDSLLAGEGVPWAADMAGAPHPAESSAKTRAEEGAER